MKEVNIHEAKTHLSRLLQRVAAGEEVTIANRGVPVARLVPARPRKPRRQLGIDAARVRIAEDFDAPLPDEIVAGFSGGREKSRRRKSCNTCWTPAYSCKPLRLRRG